MTTADRVALVPTGISGMTVFDITTQSYWYWNGVANVWKEIPNTTGNSLDAAYDAGGSGAGRTITADAGNVVIQGAGSLTVAANVGIGTTTPSEKLELEFSGRGGILLDGDNTQDAFIQFDNGGSSNYIYTDQSDNNNLKFEAGTGKSVSILSDGANERMVVQSDGRVRVNNLADVNGAVVTSNPAGVLGKTPLTGNATDVLLGTGVFGPSSAFEDDDWYESATTVAPNSINDNIYKLGTVAIGANITASAPLQVQAAGSGNPANNAILANNPTNSAGQDAIIAARVGGSAAGDPIISLDVNGESGWSLGIDNDHANRFKIAPSWSNLSATTAMTIKTDGNIGVSTDDPDQKLQVNGVIRSRGAGMIDVDAVNVAGPRVAWGTTSNVYDYMNMGAYNGMNQIETTTRDFRIGSNAATNAIYVQNASGNVGMGTNTPDANLNVGAAAGATLYLTREDNVTATNEVLGSILFDSTDDSGPSTTDGAAGIRAFAAVDHGNSNKGADLTFFTKPTTGASAVAAPERMRIQHDGNVGIGTAAPSSVFHISTTQTGNVSKLHNPTLANGSLVGHEFGKANSNYNMVEFRYNHVSDGNATNYVNLGLWGNANSLTVAGNGNVGIGTPTAAQKLHVTGTIRSTSLSGAGDRLVYTDNNGDLQRSSSAINANSLIDGAGDVNRVAYWSDANTLTSNAEFTYSSTGNLTVYNAEASTGEVRLGAAWDRPGVYSSTDLQMFAGAASNNLIFGNNNNELLRFTNTGIIRMDDTKNTYAGLEWYYADNDRYGISQSTGGNTALYTSASYAPSFLSFNLASGSGSFTELARISHAGNLGLGVTNPTIILDAKLDQIIGTSALSVSQHDASNRGTKVSFGSTSGEFAGMRIVIAAGTNGCGNTGDIRFDTWECNTSTTREVMRVNGRGNVGIGTVSPAGKLHVAAGEGDGIIIGNPNDAMGLNGGENSIKFYGYRDVVANAIGAKISAVRTDVCCGYLSQGTELAFYTNNGLTAANADNSIERVRITGAGTLEAKEGMKTERHIRFYKRSRGNNQGGVDNLGNYDFCYLAGAAFRNSDSVSDEDDDYQCNVYSLDINGSADYGENTNQDYSANFNYATRPYWRLYSECYQDCSNSTCTAMCINFDY